jgi:MYXO-CTERM domain-containing protein
VTQILYLNRCRGGCEIHPGPEDSRLNQSSIVDRTSHLGAFNVGDNAWDRVVDCVTGLYAPFGIEVTDVDPGDQPHFEAIVAGRPDDIGFGNNVGGVAPFACGVIENAVTFTFANVLSGPGMICEVIGQESAHAFGLDHEMLCSDPMTYLAYCGPKCFRDQLVPCGEYEDRECSCGNAGQNSYQYLLSRFGEGPGHEGVRFDAPHPGDLVVPGFHVRVSPQVPCPRGVRAYLEAKGGDLLLGEIGTWPYVFDTPIDLPLGAVRARVEVDTEDGVTYTSFVDVEVTDRLPDAGPRPQPDAGAPVDGPGGGCSAGGPGAAPLLALVALWARRRRNRDRPDARGSRRASRVTHGHQK